MSKPLPIHYRTTNWSSYSDALKQRGSLLIWLDKEMIWLAPHDVRLRGTIGRRTNRQAVSLMHLILDCRIGWSLVRTLNRRRPWSLPAKRRAVAFAWMASP